MQTEVLRLGTLFVVATTVGGKDTVEDGINNPWAESAMTVQAIVSKRPSPTSLPLTSHKNLSRALPYEQDDEAAGLAYQECDGINMIEWAWPSEYAVRGMNCLQFASLPHRNKAQAFNASVQISIHHLDEGVQASRVCSCVGMASFHTHEEYPARL